MVAGWLSWPALSLTVYLTGVGLPVKPAAGLKVTVPSLATFQVPSPLTSRVFTLLPLPSRSCTVVGSMSPWASRSFVRTLIVAVAPILRPSRLSSLAFGASPCGVSMVLSTLPLAFTLSLPSLTVTDTAGRSSPALTCAAPAAVRLTVPVAGSML